MTKGTAGNQPGRPGRKPSLNAEHTSVLRTIIQEQPQSSVDGVSFKRRVAAGVFEFLHDRLRQQRQDRVGKAPVPTAAIIGTKSTRSTAQGGNTGFDAGKQIKGRKRHPVVDSPGLLLAVAP